MYGASISFNQLSWYHLNCPSPVIPSPKNAEEWSAKNTGLFVFLFHIEEVMEHGQRIKAFDPRDSKISWVSWAHSVLEYCSSTAGSRCANLGLPAVHPSCGLAFPPPVVRQKVGTKLGPEWSRNLEFLCWKPGEILRNITYNDDESKWSEQASRMQALDPERNIIWTITVAALSNEKGECTSVFNPFSHFNKTQTAVVNGFVL